MGPCIYEINSVVWLREQSWARGAKADLAEIPDAQLRAWAEAGFDYIWFLGVWTKGQATLEICRNNEHLYRSFTAQLPDLDAEDIIGSPFSIAAYELSPELGGPESLNRLRERMHAHGLKLMLDFVPNHMAVDHPWVNEHPDRLVNGTPLDRDQNPLNYFSPPAHPDRIIAHGRDPYFAGWTDTAQINIFRRETRRAMIDLMLHIADRCDAVRCDMAMLLNNDVFSRTWGDLSVLDYGEGDGPLPEFWQEAIGEVRQAYPDFRFMAEVYWDLEPRMIELGFDLAYDKALYDLLRHGDGANAMALLRHTRGWEGNLVRFIENHDEDRAADAFGPRQRAAALFSACLPGALLLHEGQLEGRRHRLPVQLGRRPEENPDSELGVFYEKLLGLLKEPVLREGDFEPLAIEPAWQDNPSHRALVAAWRHHKDACRLVVANVGEYQAQGYLRLPTDCFRGKATMDFEDLLGDARYRRSRAAIDEKGLYVDLAAGEYHLFQVQPAPAGVKPDPGS